MVIGRKSELAKLKSVVNDDNSSFIAVYGRRRIGKTYLVREAYDYRFTFSHAGIYGGDREEELYAFSVSLRDAGLEDFEEPKNWLQAFELLRAVVKKSDENKKIIFLDELSWMDTAKSDFIKALENFWNGWASGRKDVVLIICSSVTSWIVNNIIHNKGGLYNRLTLQIGLEPFTLRECEEYVNSNGLALNRHQIIEAYMILGGVPYYWGFLEKGYSLSQNIDDMFFSSKAPLANEFEYMFESLFKKPDEYIKIIDCLSSKRIGLTRGEILDFTGISTSGNFTKKLKDLENSGFIREYRPYKKKKNDVRYQLIDPYVLFHHQFLKDKPNDKHYWSNQINTPKRNTWNGLAFEMVCLWHIDQIKHALGISGIISDVCTWSCKADEDNGVRGTQIDLMIERGDNVINILEMKFSTSEYMITKKVRDDLIRKRNDFLIVTKARSAVHLTMITPYGIANNSYSGDIQSQVTGEELFK